MQLFKYFYTENILPVLASDEYTYLEKEWFRRTAGGDSKAFTELFHHYNARLFPFVRRITKSESAAEEIVQETFLRLWVHRATVGVMEKPAAWLFLIASNLSMSHLRNRMNAAVKHAGAFARSETAAGDSFLQELEGKEMAVLVEAAIQLLPPKRQEVFRLSRQEGLTYQQIADRLDISPNTVKDHLVIALRSIREYLNDHSETSLGIILLIEIVKNS